MHTRVQFFISRVAEPHYFDATPALGKNFYAALALAPASSLLHIPRQLFGNKQK
jgi:hypothetical protein